MQGDQLNHLRSLLESHLWDEAWAEFQRLRGDGPPSAHMLLMGSHAAFNRWDLFQARHLADEAMETWSEGDPPKLLGQIRFHLGMTTRELGDSYVALEQFELFLSELSSKYPELSMGEGKAYFHLALTKRQRKDLDGALEAYHKAIACCRRDGLPNLLCMSLQNLAWLLCHMRRPSEANVCLQEAADLLSTPVERIHQTLGEAFLAAVEGDHVQASRLCEGIFRRVESGEEISVDVQSQAAWVAGTAALEQGNLESAAALVEVALTYATESKDARLINDASALRREVHTRKRAGA